MPHIPPTPALMPRSIPVEPAAPAVTKRGKRTRRNVRVQRARDLARWENEGGALDPREWED